MAKVAVNPMQRRAFDSAMRKAIADAGLSLEAIKAPADHPEVVYGLSNGQEITVKVQDINTMAAAEMGAIAKGLIAPTY